MNKRVKYGLILMVAAWAGLLVGWQVERQASAVSINKDNLIRFHVIANSNSAADQALKYHVRDVVVKAMARRFQGAEDVNKARQIVRNNLEYIKELASERVKAAGYDYPVSVSLGEYQFPAKSYNLRGENGKPKYLSLPAGTYEAVRVVIGEGNGANWWCVLFPPLCFVNNGKQGVPESVPVTPHPKGNRGYTPPPAENHDDSEKAVPAFKLEPGPEIMSSAQEPGEVQFKFRCAELYNQTVQWLSTKLG